MIALLQNMGMMVLVMVISGMFSTKLTEVHSHLLDLQDRLEDLESSSRFNELR